MRLLRWLTCVVLVLAIEGCLWRPPPIPPARGGGDASTGLTQDSATENPTTDTGVAADASAPPSDANGPRDAQPQEDAQEPDATEDASDDGATIEQ